jgi:hypothetical protein
LIGLAVAACSLFEDECEPVERWCNGDVLRTCYLKNDIHSENCGAYGATCVEDGTSVYCGYPEVECDPAAETSRRYCFGSYLASCSKSSVHQHPSPVHDCQELSGADCVAEPADDAEYHGGAYCGFSHADCPVDGWGEVCVGDVLGTCEGSAHPVFEEQCGERDHDTYCVEDEPLEHDGTSYTSATCAFHPQTCETGDRACSPDFDFLWLRCSGFAYTLSYRCAPGLTCVEGGPYGVSCE